IIRKTTKIINIIRKYKDILFPVRLYKLFILAERENNKHTNIGALNHQNKKIREFRMLRNNNRKLILHD
ncbi:hypothetical protein JVW21_21350, partial [Vibrio cholerae O1]|uniref:hypothetical protein n=1 Tax=Vibrio cholerae TaxID=666 RepID=UPI001C107472